MSLQLIKNAIIVNDGQQFKGSVLVNNGRIMDIFSDEKTFPDCIVFDAGGEYLLPGVIDSHVHFRDPGFPAKGDLFTESKAGLAGGVTSYMEMPNTIPQTTTCELLAKKFELASQKSLSNYSFYVGATNNNINELSNVDFSKVCGVKLFMGSSTGNMLVDNGKSLKELFSQTQGLIAVHCEDEEIITKNIELFRAKYGEDVPFRFHPSIRNDNACFRSSAMAVELAHKYNTRLHILHLSTAKELQLLSNDILLSQKRITGEVCVHHLWFCDADYDKFGSLIKLNPAIKTANDRECLFSALLDGKIDVVATDHAPHTLAEKNNTYFKAPSGAPFIQHSLTAMLEFFHNNLMTIEQIVEKMCHNPAQLFKVKERGYLRKGYWADMILIDTKQTWQVSSENIFYKCGWSPLEGQKFRSAVTHTWVNGNLVYENAQFNETFRGMPLEFT